MNGCDLCLRENSTRDQRGGRPQLHKICILCGKEIHTTQSWHADGQGARHERCELEEMQGKRLGGRWAVSERSRASGGSKNSI